MKKIMEILDGLYYITMQIGIFVAAFKGSLIWVCVCGFCLIDGLLTQIFLYKRGFNKTE